MLFCSINNNEYDSYSDVLDDDELEVGSLTSVNWTWKTYFDNVVC